MLFEEAIRRGSNTHKGITAFRLALAHSLSDFREILTQRRRNALVYCYRE